MPIREKRTERIAGLFVLIGLIMLGCLIIQFGSFDDQIKDSYELSVEFPDASGIIADSEVRFRGTKVGKVATSPELIMKGNESTVLMKMSIRDDVKIEQGSLFRVASSGFIGDKFIEIVPFNNGSGKYYTTGQTIAGESSGGFDALKEDAESIAEETLIILKEVQGTIKKVNTSLDSIERVGEKIDLTVTSLNEDFLTKKNADSVSLIMANFQASSSNIKAASAELKPAIAELRPAIAELRPAIAEARTTLTSIQKSTELALQNVPSAIKNIDIAATKASKTMDTLQNGNGLLGILTQDPEVGTDAKDFLKNIKRYGILRYRDDESPETYDPRNKFRGSRR